MKTVKAKGWFCDISNWLLKNPEKLKHIHLGTLIFGITKYMWV